MAGCRSKSRRCWPTTRLTPSGTRTGCMRKADKANLFIKIPGTPEGLAAIEEVIFDGVPVNVTLLFSREQVLAAAEAYLRGIERRLAAGLDPNVASVLSLFVSRWDVAVKQDVASPLPQSSGHRHRHAHLPGARRTAGLGALAAPGRRRRAPAAPAVGQHRHQGSRGAGHACTSRRWPRPAPSTPCPRRRCWPLPITARSSGRCRPTAATPKP